mgnify:CR=1 FL=1
MSFAGWITLITTVVITGISGMILYDRHQKKNAPVVIITEFNEQGQIVNTLVTKNYKVNSNYIEVTPLNSKETYIIKGPLKFNLFKTIHPSKDNTIWKWGLYGTQGHFLWCTEVLGLELETVPILGEMTITKDLLLQFQQAPKEDGEGVVIEFEDGTHYKAKSMDYYSNI